MDSTTLTSTYAGVSQGAAAGSMFGPWGTAIGAVAGGAMGLVAGNKAKKAKKYQKKAAAIQAQREQNAVNAQYRAMLRQARTARAGSLAESTVSGLNTSSLQTSALSSLGSQAQYNVQYLAEDRRLFQLYSNYMQRAGANANTYSNLISTIGSLDTFTKDTMVTAGRLTDAGSAIGSKIGSLASSAYDSLSTYFTTDTNTTDVQKTE